MTPTPSPAHSADSLTDAQIEAEARNYALFVRTEMTDGTVGDYDITKYECREDFFNCVRACAALAGAPAQPSQPHPYGWLQYIDGLKTQNFARDEKELADIKQMFKVMGHTGKAEYLPVYVFSAPPDAKPQSDGCKFCLGAKGGVPGNANVIGGETVCDYCTSLLMKVCDAEKANPTSSIFAQPAQPVLTQQEPVAWCLRSIGGKVVYMHESRGRVADEQPCIKTPTTIEALVFAAAHPSPVSGAAEELRNRLATLDRIGMAYNDAGEYLTTLPEGRYFRVSDVEALFAAPSPTGENDHE